MRLDFDFGHVNGYATAHRTLPLDLPANYEISFWIRGNAPVNNLQFKLIDASGDNVWWLNQPNFAFPHQWRKITIKQRQLAFAWGPIKDHTLRHSAALEFVVSSGRDGGRGSVEFDQLTIRPLPPPQIHPPQPTATASPTLPGSSAANALDGDPATAWKSGRVTGPQHFDIDLHEAREFGGITLDWEKGQAATDYDIAFSDDGKSWHVVRRVRGGNGGENDLLLTESRTRYVRLKLLAGQTHEYGLSEVKIRSLDWGASPNAFFKQLARNAPRGTYPRGFSEQPYWTVIGVDGGPSPGLISEDGAIEPHKGGFSVEPFLLEADQLASWADVQPKQSLRDGSLPMPRVRWQAGPLQLQIDAFAVGTPKRSQIVARYRVHNDSSQARDATLILAVRPFQVNPPAQFLNTIGGASPIHDLAWNGDSVSVNRKPGVWPLMKPDQFIAMKFDAGQIPQRLMHRPWLKANHVHDAFGFASGALVYRLSLPPHDTSEVALVMPMTGAVELPAANISASDWVRKQDDQVALSWREKLDRVALKLPTRAQYLGDTLRTALADILILRDGPALQPGARSYSRSWIRDGAMMADALLRLGAIEPAREYVDWYAPHQFKTGKVPCCVDWRGSDPVPENDSQGELIHAIAQLYRYDSDLAELAKNWPHVQAAVAYMDKLRRSQRGPENETGKRRAFLGLMPASISHEGYSAKPMHSYWDDFWSLAGYNDAIDVATALGKTEAAERFTRSRDEFRHDLLASIKLATKQRNIDYIPGCAELGDFDPTSTTIALSPAGQLSLLPQSLLHATFERYWKNFAARLVGSAPWQDYTPYEWRGVSAMTRLGWRDRAFRAVHFFFDSGDRPRGWNQWAEVVGHDKRKIRFVGDMPHGWVASDFIRSTLDLFAYLRYADNSLVLAAGVPADWLEGDGIGIEGLRTPFGKLDYTLKQAAGHFELHLAAGARPPGGFMLTWPLSQPPGATTVNGQTTHWRHGELHIAKAPANVVIALRPSQY